MNGIIPNEEYAHEHYQYLYKRINKANLKKEHVRELEEFLKNHPLLIMGTLFFL